MGWVSVDPRILVGQLARDGVVSVDVLGVSRLREEGGCDLLSADLEEFQGGERVHLETDGKASGSVCAL